jgi:hypothetical protein
MCTLQTDKPTEPSYPIADTKLQLRFAANRTWNRTANHSCNQPLKHQKFLVDCLAWKRESTGDNFLQRCWQRLQGTLHSGLNLERYSRRGQFIWTRFSRTDISAPDYANIECFSVMQVAYTDALELNPKGFIAMRNAQLLLRMFCAGSAQGMHV